MPDSSLIKKLVAGNANLPESEDLCDLLSSLNRAALWRSLVRGVAHDLNNTSQVFTLNEPADIVDQVRTGEWSSTARWITNKLALAIELLQDFAKAEEIDVAPVIVGDVITTIEEWQRYQKAQPPIPVRVEISPDTKPVRAVAVQLRQVFLALLANAKEAMSESEAGEIVVTTTTLDHGAVLIAVEDAGTGIPANMHERIFDPFYTTKNSRDHIGLGATVSRHLVESWDGSLSAENRADGPGTRLLIQLNEWGSSPA